MGREHIVVWNRYPIEYCSCGEVATVGYFCEACLYEQTKHATKEELEEAGEFIRSLLEKQMD